MELWFTENHAPGARFSIKVEKQVYSQKSEYQQIDIFDSKEFGRFMTLDGYMMLTQRDEFIYHEMITHTAMAVNPKIQKVLVIGGGDGGAVRELTKYQSIQTIHLVEIDEMVIEASKKYMPFTADKLNDPRVLIMICDGLRYVRSCKEAYDLIIVDSTDPFGPGEGLFTKEFYGNCEDILSPEGILINQHESPFYGEDALAMQRAHKRIYETFPISKCYQAHIPTYPSGHWLFGFASKKYDPINDFKGEEWIKFGLETKYYNRELHKGAFCLPNYVKELLNEVE